MNTAEHLSAQLESGLGLRPPEFESRILRQLPRGNAAWPRFVGRARLDPGPKLVSSGGRGHHQTDMDGASMRVDESGTLCDSLIHEFNARI
jgi:hypothetical protein